MPENGEELERFGMSFASGATSSRWIALLETAVSMLVVWGILRYLGKSTANYQVEWIVIAVLPVVFWLLFTGRLASVKAFGVELTSAIRRESSETIVLDMEIRYQSINTELKTDQEAIPGFIAERTAALGFELGKRGYYNGGVIREYLEGLLPHGFFKYAVFNREDGSFAAMMPAYQLYLVGSLDHQAFNGFQRVVDAVEKGSVVDFPGVVTAKAALKVADTKSRAMEIFSRNEADELPVLNDQGRLVGVVTRGKLMSEILASILRAAKGKS